MLKKISELEKYYNLEDYDDSYLNENNSCGSFFVYDTVLNEKYVGSLQKYQITLHIEGGEGYIPHFHLCYKSGKNVIMRIKLLDSEYFREKDDVCNVLNSRQRKALNEYLQEKIPKTNDTNWRYLCMTWNLYNPSHAIENIDSLKIPDYATIKEPK